MTKIVLGLLQAFLIAGKIMKIVDASWIVVLSPIMSYYAFNILLLIYAAYVKTKEEERVKNSPYKSKWQQKLEELQKQQKK